MRKRLAYLIICWTFASLMTGCNDSTPTRAELEAENQELRSHLAMVQEHVAKAKSELDDLQSQISYCEGEDCNALDTSDIENALNEIEQETM